MTFIDDLINKASMLNKTIILPEGNDERIIEAAKICKGKNIADIILIGENKNGLDLNYINPLTYSRTEEFASKLYELRKEKGLSIEDAKKLILNDNMYFACMMLHEGLADGIVSGASHSSSDTLRPALQIIKSEQSLVSAFFLMEKDDKVFIFADAGLIQEPNSDELATIAVSSANSYKELTGLEPKVAFLSHSSFKSAPDTNEILKVREAVSKAKALNREYTFDGEMQVDVALDRDVAFKKAPNSLIKGDANVLIFPNLDAGNIGYKLVQRLGGFSAYGPITQGIKKPINDLSRGCSTEDIVGVIAITCLQSK